MLHGLARFSRLVGGESTTLIGLGVLTGVVAGLAAVLFVMLVRGVNTLVWAWQLGWEDITPADALVEHTGGLAHEVAPHLLVDLPPWYPLAVVPVGMMAVVWFVRRFSPEAGGHGVPEVMGAVAQRSGLMKGRVGWVKLVASSVNIGMGGSVGKEGPIVQVGAAFGSVIGRFFGMHGRPMRTLVGCGAAAGIAAVFNAPIAGVLFALEIIIGSYNLTSFAPVLIASVAGAVTSREFLGAESAFAIPASLRQGLTIATPWEFAAYALLGLLIGVISVGFTRFMAFTESTIHRWKASIFVKAALTGLAVGGLGLLLPRILGEGHHTMTEALLADSSLLPWKLLLALGLLKTLATVLTIGGGGSGGVFAPSLFVGAVLGAAFGQALELLFPGSVGSSGAYALAGMAAILAGTAHAPMTGILLLFEMSDNYLLILPLMTSSVLAYVVAARMFPESIYTLPLSRKGVVLRDREDTALLRRLRVADAMQPPMDAIPETATFNRIVRRLLQSDQHDFPVVDAEGRLTGAISLDDVREFLREDQLDMLLLARDCAHPVETVTPRTTLLEAMEFFDHHYTYEIPVVQDGRLVGSLRRSSVLRTYRRALVAEHG